MLESLKHKLAKVNGVEKKFIDDEIGASVKKDFSPNEENAIDRKMLYAIADAIGNAGIKIDPVTLAEFLTYHTTVETTKENIKNLYKGEPV